jgi:hypothetical protein
VREVLRNALVSREMKTALVTTTVNVPEVLRLYRAHGPEVAFFVTGDMKSDSVPCIRYVRELGNAKFYDVLEQRDLGYACSELLGWNTTARRSIAILEALKWGAEVIVTVDDDNVPLSPDYFDRFEQVLSRLFNGLQAGGNEWFDVGSLLVPKAPHRGFPTHRAGWAQLDHVVGAKVGVAAGICLGDPDVSAVERISNHPVVHGVSEVLRTGIVVDPSTHTVFNSQNTAFLRELAPCFLMCPQFLRFDDIFASLIAQRVMRERGLHVHFGQPFVWQQRNPHDLLKDLTAEMWGMRRVVEFAGWLDQLQISEMSVLTMTSLIYSEMQHLQWMPAGVSELGLVWCSDLEKVL